MKKYFTFLFFLFYMMQTIFPQAINFSVSTDFNTGTSPASVAYGDLNGDGKQDVVVTNYVSNTVSVFLNTTTNGSSTPSFSTRADFTTGNGPISVAIGDLNGDGKLDIIVANSNDNTVSVFFNTTTNGSSTPSFAAKTNFTTGTTPYYVAAADLNGDGRLDIVTANPVSNNISVLLNTTSNGASTPYFTGKTDFATGSSCRWVAIADLNGDGKSDIVSANYGANTVSVLLNTTSNGTYTPSFSADNIFTTGTNPAAVAIADVNKDGKPDIVAANYSSNTVSVFFNTTADSASTPTFSSKTDFTTSTGPTAITVSDLNGDGKPDIVTANYNANTISVLLDTTSNGASIPSFTAKTDFSVGTNPRGVVIADLNGDYKPDIVTANIGTNNISALLNTTPDTMYTPLFSSMTNFNTGSSPASVAYGDLNGDGKQDVVVANYASNTISVFIDTTPDSTTTPSFSTKTDFTTGNAPISVAIADLNGDGRLDIAVANSNDNTVSVFFNTTPNGVSTPSFTAKKDFTTGATPYYVAIANLNGDGKPDIITANPNSNNISVLLNTTSSGASVPSFSAKTDFSTGSSCRWIGIGDFNGDGKLDIATANYGANTISVLLNTTPDSAITPSFSTNALFTTGTNPASIAISDINRDGLQDIVVDNYGSNTVSVFFNTTPFGATSPSFSTKTDFTTGTGPTAVAVSDLKGKGKSDIVIANYNSNNVSVLLNTTIKGASIPTFSSKTDFSTGTNPRGVTITDINGDNKPDIITDNIGTNNISVLLNNNYNISQPIEIFSDKNFSNGIGLQGDSSSNPSVIDTLYPFGMGDSSYSWTLAQWGSRFNLAGVPPSYQGDSVVYADSGKSVSFMKITGNNQITGNTQVDMEVFGSAEYLSPRTAGQSWPSLYFGQTLQKQLGINEMNSLVFRCSARLMFSINEMGSSYNPSLHTAQFQVYLTIQNLNINSSDYGDYYWFGIPFYDYRYPEIPAYAASDFGPNNTGKFIFNLGTNDIYTGNFADGNWINISKDIYPYIMEGFQIAQARGYLVGSSITDMCIGSLNIGWEIPGTFNSGLQFNKFALTALCNNLPSYKINNLKIKNNSTPSKYSLSQNYPNPFNPSTEISYSVPKTGIVIIKVYNILGQEVATLVNQEQKAGSYIINFNASKYSSGIYIYRMQSDNFFVSKKMVLLK
ncbi:MAG: T9SS type A sorting domain-containing protein [Bacteroidetes bacterium]|nr:T9SS type A sorting domain-containing protein [Bacteroidota bacterium]